MVLSFKTTACVFVTNIMIQTLRWRQYKTLLTSLLLSSVLVNSFVQARIEKNLSTFLHSLQRVQLNDVAQ